MLQLRSSAFDAGADNQVMIKGQLKTSGQHVVNWLPGRTRRVGARHRFWKPGCDRKVGNRNDPPPRVPPRIAVGTQLLKVQLRSVKVRLFAQLPVRGGHDVLAAIVEESAGQRLIPQVRLDPPLHEQHMKR